MEDSLNLTSFRSSGDSDGAPPGDAGEGRGNSPGRMRVKAWGADTVEVLQ